MAAPPSTASPASWNPAVPPPPVTGAGGYEVYEGLAGGVGLALSLGVGLGLAEALALAFAEAVGALTDGEATEIETLGVGVLPEVPVPLEVQAESATQASMAVKPQPTAVSLTPCAVPAMAARALIEPPHALGNDHFPVAHRRNRHGKETVWPAFGR
jgi:hypothetical protein